MKTSFYAVFMPAPLFLAFQSKTKERRKTKRVDVLLLYSLLGAGGGEGENSDDSKNASFVMRRHRVLIPPPLLEAPCRQVKIN
jgi:hypothetical protein